MCCVRVLGIETAREKDGGREEGVGQGEEGRDGGKEREREEGEGEQMREEGRKRESGRK